MMFYYLLSGLSVSIDGARAVIKAIDWVLWSASVAIDFYQRPGWSTTLKLLTA